MILLVVAIVEVISSDCKSNSDSEYVSVTDGTGIGIGIVNAQAVLMEISTIVNSGRRIRIILESYLFSWSDHTRTIYEKLKNISLNNNTGFLNLIFA